MLRKSALKVPYMACVLLSLVALAPMPYGYYQLLKIVIACSAGITAYIEFKSEEKAAWLAWSCIMLTIIFNPIIPIHLTKEIWMGLNLIAVGLFGYLTYLTRKEE